MILVAIPVLSTLLLLGSPDEKRISIYSTVANYTLPVLERNGQNYVGLFEILEPLGTVSVKGEGSRWKVRYNNVESEFTAGKAMARIQGRDFDLPANFLLEDGRGLVPLTSLSTLLPRFLGGPVTLHENSRRLFVGNVAVHFTAQVNKSAPLSLVMNFTSPVNPMISTEPGKLRMVFTHEPLVPPGSQTLTFDSKTIPSASYQENNGAAEIIVAGALPLFASFSNDGRTITVAPAPQAGSKSSPQGFGAQTGTVAATAQLPSSSTIPGAATNGVSPSFAIVDASHGGDERGAALSDQLAEKDVTLAFARRLRQELETRGITVSLVREGDTTIGPDQRAALVNRAHPAIYISVHATSQGSGIRLYTALLPSGGESRGPFVDWDSAQASAISLSQTAESSIAAEFRKGQIPVRSLAAPLRPLNNITSAAIAFEVAPQAGDIGDLNSPAYQQLVTSSVAAGVLAVRDKLEATR